MVGPPRGIALTGASGRLGHVIGNHLDASGWPVRRLGRAMGFDLAMEDFRPFLQGCQGLVHTAFAHVPGFYRGGEGDDPERFWELNFISTLRLLDQAREMGVRRVILFSSRAVYGAAQGFNGQSIDETTVAKPDSHYGLLKLSTETLGALYTDAGMAVTVLRATGIYGGPPKLNKWTSLFQAALQGQAPKINRMATEVHGLSVAKAVVLALECQDQARVSGVFNLSEVCVTTAQILNFAGFDTISLPPVRPMQGPILSAKRLQALGLKLEGLDALAQAAKDLRAALET